MRMALSFLLGLIFLGIWFYVIDPSILVGYFLQIDVRIALLSALVYVISYLIRSLRWNVILSTVQRVPPLSTYNIFMGSNFINYVIPIRAGEIAKCYFLKRKYNLRVSRTLPTVFIDKLFDSIAIFIVLLLIPFLPIHISKPLWGLISIILGIVLIGIFILIAASLAHEKTTAVILNLFFFLPEKQKMKVKEVFSLFMQGVGLFRHHYMLIPQIVFLTLFAVLTDTLVVILLFWAFGTPIGFFTVLFGYTLIYLSYVLPHPPAQIGSNELLMVLIFSVGFGLDKNLVSAVMTFGHLLTGLLIVILGVIALSWTGTSIFSGKELLDETEDANERS